MRTTRLAAASLAALSLTAFASAAVAQQGQPTPATTPAPAAPAAAAPAPSAPGSASAQTAAKPADPVVAKVGNDEIHLSDVQEAANGVPAQYRQMPAQVLYPMLLDQLVDRRAISAYAEKQGFDKTPEIQKAMARAAQTALQNGFMQKEIGPQITDAALRARYDATIAGKPGEEEVHARHILVASEDEAKKIIGELNKGGDFAALAKAHSTDPGSAQGGDLGWFKKGDMLPEFSSVAFSLKPGQISQTPVHTRYGWHVIKVEETRVAPPQSFDQAKDQIRQDIIQAAVQNVVREARAGVTIQRFNPDGSVPKATDAATPPPAPASAPAPQTTK